MWHQNTLLLKILPFPRILRNDLLGSWGDQNDGKHCFQIFNTVQKIKILHKLPLKEARKEVFKNLKNNT